MAGREHVLLSRREIEGMIADGRSLFVLNQYVIKADAWIPYHPGGDKAIAHMVGRDATDEVTVYHNPETLKNMSRYRVGRIEGRWVNFIPPIQGGTFRPLPHIGEEMDDTESSLSSSASTTRAPSPIFDQAESILRKRNTWEGLPTSPSVSSVSSVEEDDGMTYLDSVTKEQVSLDLDQYPALDYDTQDAIVNKYRELHKRVEAEGLYQCRYSAYAIEACRYSLLLGGMLLFLSWEWYILSAVCLGALWHQLVFTAHDCGHMGITHNFYTDTIIGILIADFVGGLSLGWWKKNHNVHHFVTNSPEHDPDIEHMPFMAVSHRLLGSLFSTYYDRVMKYDVFAKFMIRIQPYTYYILMLFGRFNLYQNSWRYLIMGEGPRKGPAAWLRWLEVIGNVFFWSWFGYGILYKTLPTNWDRFVYLMVSHMVTTPVHVQITLSHFAMSTADLGPHESFPQKMLRTTMDVDCPPWLDFFHGGLQFQAIHHLFPRIPRHNFRQAQKLVQEFCDEVGIPYALYGFTNGNQQVIGRLADVSRQAAILAKCQKVMVENGDALYAHAH